MIFIDDFMSVWRIFPLRLEFLNLVLSDLYVGGQCDIMR